MHTNQLVCCAGLTSCLTEQLLKLQFSNNAVSTNLLAEETLHIVLPTVTTGIFLLV